MKIASKLIRLVAATALVLAAVAADAAPKTVSMQMRESAEDYSQFKTFRDFTDALREEHFVTKAQIKSIQDLLESHGLTLESELTREALKDDRLSFGSARVVQGSGEQMKTGAGRILGFKDSASADEVFEQTMKLFNDSTSALDLLIDKAHAQAS